MVVDAVVGCARIVDGEVSTRYGSAVASRLAGVLSRTRSRRDLDAARRLLASIVLMAAGLGTAAASEIRTPYFVGEVVVTGEADAEQAGPGTVSVVDAETIRELGVSTVAEAVQYLAGASMSVGARNEQRIWVRGYEPSQVLVLLDGIPIADPYSGEVDLGQLPVGDVARIVLSRGAASSAYGPGGMGGVVNIVTVQGAGSPGVTTDLRLSDRATVRAHAAAGGSRADVDWYLGVGFESSDGWPLSSDFEPTDFEDGGLRSNSDLERWSVLARFGRGFGESGRLTATLRFIGAEKGVPFSTERPAGFVRFARFPEWRQGTAAIGWESNLGLASTIRAQLHAHRFDNTLAVYGDQDLAELRLNSIFADDVLGGWAVLDTRAGRHGLTASLHFNGDRHRRLEAAPGGDPVRTERYVVRSGAVALEDSVRLGARAVLTVSAALQHHAVVESWQVASGDGPTHSTTELSPQAELDVQLGAGVTGSVAAYRRTGFPTLRQLFAVDAPNPELEPQLSTGVAAGVEWRPDDRSRLAVGVYADRVDGLISRLGRGFRFENQDRADLAGLELSLRRTWRSFDLGLEGALRHAELVASSQGLAEVPYVPDATLDADLGFALAPRAEIRMRWSWAGSRVWYDGPTREVLDPYQLLRLSWVWRQPHWGVEVALENALDAVVEQEWGYPLPGRRLWVGFNLRP